MLSPRARDPVADVLAVVGVGHMPGYDRVLVEIRTVNGGHFELMAHARPDTVFTHIRENGGTSSEWTVTGHFADDDTFESHVGVSRDACRISQSLPSGVVRLETPGGLVIDDPTETE